MTLPIGLPIGLHLVTLILCIITLTLATAALMPQIKQAVVILRDGLLWMALIVVVGVVGVVGWGRFFKVVAERHQQGSMDVDRSPIVAPTASRGATSPTASVPQATLALHAGPVDQRASKPAFSANRSRPLDERTWDTK